MGVEGTFDSIQASIPRARGRCHRCGKPGKAAGTVRVAVNRYVGTKPNPQSVATRAISFCEPCCVAVYGDLEATLLAAGGKR